MTTQPEPTLAAPTPTVDGIFDALKADAREAYRKLAFGLADGEPADPTTLSQILSAAGKSPGDLRADVDLLKRRRQAAMDLEEAGRLAAELPALRNEIASLTSLGDEANASAAMEKFDRTHRQSLSLRLGAENVLVRTSRARRDELQLGSLRNREQAARRALEEAKDAAGLLPILDSKLAGVTATPTLQAALDHWTWQGQLELWNRREKLRPIAAGLAEAQRENDAVKSGFEAIEADLLAEQRDWKAVDLFPAKAAAAPGRLSESQTSGGWTTLVRSPQ